MPQPLWTVMDWRKPAVKRRSLRFIWGGDIMYEQRFAAPVLDFLEYALAEGGAAWVAEPSRAVYDTFRSMLVNRRWAGRCVWEKNIEALYPQERPVPVRIWEIHRLEGATMGETVRFGVSLDSDLLEKFDALCERQGCPSRSEALRDIIRDALVQDSLHSETADAAGVLSLIYDHHVRDLSRKLTERQHDAHGLS